MARSNGLQEQAYSYLEKALATDKNCVRANLLLGKFATDAGNYDDAIVAYQKIKGVDPDYISEVINPLAHCYNQTNQNDAYMGYLSECLTEHPRISVVLGISEHIRNKEGDMAAIAFITEQIRLFYSLRGLSRLVELYVSNVDANTKNKLLLLQSIIEKLLKNKPIYRCANCGFAGKTLYWQCPSCKRWSSFKPIHGLEGD
jgi:lipopolysaccharide biosynthesis regulator YciM